MKSIHLPEIKQTKILISKCTQVKTVVKFEVFTGALIQAEVFWVATLGNVVGYKVSEDLGA
jgi:hypothetical protein